MADPQYVWPVQGKSSITNPYGATQVRSAGFKGPLPSSNVGLDLGAPEGTPLVAIADGTVIESGWNTSGWGNTLLVKTPDGNTYRLSHMKQAPTVGVGAKITQGAPVGQVGQSGNATGPHVDVEVRNPSGQNIDPTPLLSRTALPRTGTAAVTGATIVAENPLRRELQTQLQGAHLAKSDADTAFQAATAALAAAEASKEGASKGQRDAVEDARKGQTAAAKSVSDLYRDVAAIDAKAQADAGKPPTGTRSPEQQRIDTANADLLEGKLVDAKRQRDALADPNSPEGRKLGVEIAKLEVDVKGARQKLDQAAALFPGELTAQGLTNQGTAASTDFTRARAAEIGAKTGPEIQRILASAGLDDAQKAQILAKIQPGVDQILAETDFTKAKTDELTQTLDVKIRQLAANAGLDEAKIAEVTGLLAGRIAQQGAELAQTTAQT
ncbi:MAG TPA: M23 family metallopeptidase, partial [Chloroflexota bacterium]|nr:M23 family metallopeptidase [Chloroflexota bacterium]